MTSVKLFDTEEVAVLCDRESSHIRRLCKSLGIGVVERFPKGRRRLLSRRDVLLLQKHIAASNGQKKRRLHTGT